MGLLCFGLGAVLGFGVAGFVLQYHAKKAISAGSLTEAEVARFVAARW